MIIKMSFLVVTITLMISEINMVTSNIPILDIKYYNFLVTIQLIPRIDICTIIHMTTDIKNKCF